MRGDFQPSPLQTVLPPLSHASPRHSRGSKHNAYPRRSSNSRDHALLQNTKEGGFTLRCPTAKWDVSDGSVDYVDNPSRFLQMPAQGRVRLLTRPATSLQYGGLCITTAEVNTHFVGCSVRAAASSTATEQTVVRSAVSHLHVLSDRLTAERQGSPPPP